MKLARFAVAIIGGQRERRIQAGAVSHVRDSDAIEVAGQTIRLQGLAVPKGDEPEVTRPMDRLAAGPHIRCELTESARMTAALPSAA